MSRGRMTRGEYQNKSNAHYGNGSHAKPDYKRPYQQRGYTLQNFVDQKKIIDIRKKSKLVRLLMRE